jgi:hypothetical protein
MMEADTHDAWRALNQPPEGWDPVLALCVELCERIIDRLEAIDRKLDRFLRTPPPSAK